MIFIKDANELLALLQFMEKKNIINLDDVRNAMKKEKKKAILEKHQYDIWQGQNGRWYTYLPDSSQKAKRRLIAKSSREKLETTICDFYGEADEAARYAGITLKGLYQEWLGYKALHTNASTYVRRIDDDYRKYYLGDSIIDVPLTRLDFLALDEWTHQKIKEHGMTKTQYYNMSIIMRQELDYAVTKGILKENPFRKVEVESRMLQKSRKKPDHTQVFLTDEQPLIEEEAEADFASDPACTTPLAILLTFQTGVRIGELVALRWCDIDGNRLHIQRMEVKRQEQQPDGSWKQRGYEVVEHAKTTAGDREIILTKRAQQILKEIRKSNLQSGCREDDYIFVGPEGRIHTRAVDARVRKYCDHINILAKSMHKIRKTYISTLLDAGFNVNFVRAQVGQEDERTTLGNYCFSRLTDRQTEEKLEAALSG
ncbi:Site-specific recombinase XerD [Anaerobium acetethylicum]|uniref:Site-specific recombinase XerD n=2 Tax=Anaerobium acetethylicum TaxID=1619234 RepID=A0A1D3TTA8_9FIRM|nr:Site-specific recombinase XerD [Anaerobium acetethylicum]